MTPIPASARCADDLRRINLELSALMCTEPADLVLGADQALADDLVVCGILGGKDVGKTTLINALASRVISTDAREVGRGTDQPIAFVHRDMQDVVAARLGEIAHLGPLTVSVHEAEAVRNVVLVDLPDFDSEFARHLRIVSDIAPLLDRVLWVLTPRKIGDRAWVEMFAKVIKDPGNVHCVLNKVDELLADAEPFGTGDGGARPARRFWDAQNEWMAESIAAAGCPQADDRRFLIAAAFADVEALTARIAHLWDDPEFARYGVDQEAAVEVAGLATADLDRLRTCVLGPVSADQGVRIKTGQSRPRTTCQRREDRRAFPGGAHD